MRFTNERDGQKHFYEEYLPLIDRNLEEDDILLHYTDGVVNGNILEFKLKIDNLNSTLFQAIKYLSKLRINGESVPKNILLISLNTKEIYRYDSEEYLSWIEKQYFGGASIKNQGFIAGNYEELINYETPQGSARLIELLRSSDFTKINIDETCIVGWADRYYREVPGSSKGDFIGDVENKIGGLGEIREPKYFKDLIYPYKGGTNEKFAYLLDKLNDRLTQKETGAFYTPKAYAEKAYELVKMAIDRVPEGNDYIIFDFCAGTGNLEEIFPEEVLGHCVLSTYEYYEYRVLVQKLGDKVRYIIPPTESMVEYANGFVRNADALSKEFINNPVIKSYVEDPKMTIIMYENPPYRDITAQDKERRVEKSYVYHEFIKNGTNESAHREYSNLFIWRAFKYYLRQPTDSYIVFSPIKYWKFNKIVNKKMIKGFLFNRKHFHASASSISCILWSNIDSDEKSIALQAYDIYNNQIVEGKQIKTEKIYSTLNLFNDKREFENDTESNIFLETNGYPSIKKTDKKACYNDNIVGYLRATSINMNSLSRCLTRTITYDALTQSYGFYLRSDNYKDKLPLFVAKLFPQDNWYEKDIYFTTSDGGNAYTKDPEFLKSCLIYTCLSNQNKCLSFTGSDGRYYKNELCFDKKTLASKDLEKCKLNEDEKDLIKLWNRILENAKKTNNYNKDLSYGIYQIDKELNTFIIDKAFKSRKKVYDYPELNGDLVTLRNKLKEYYKKYITEKMFKYELIK